MGAIRAQRTKGWEGLEPRLVMTAEVAPLAPAPLDHPGDGGGAAPAAVEPPRATAASGNWRQPSGSRAFRWEPSPASASAGKAAGKQAPGEAGKPNQDPFVHRTGIRYRADSPAALLDVYTPEGAPPPGGWPVVVAIHSGNPSQGGRGYYGSYASSLTLMGYLVVAPDYTLAKGGGISWPRSLDDVREAVRWVRANKDLIGADPTRIAAVGESAGGQLAALLGTSPADPESRVQAVISFHAPYDMLAQAASGRQAAKRVSAMLGGSFYAAPDRYWDASPLNQVSPGDAPMLILHGTADRSVPIAQARAMASALADAGIFSGLKVIPGAGSEFRFRSRQGDHVPLMLEFLNDAFAIAFQARQGAAGSAPAA